MIDNKIKAAIFEASNWQNHATADEKSQLTYNAARDKVLQRIFEALDRTTQSKTVEEIKKEWFKRSDWIRKTKSVSVDLIWEYFYEPIKNLVDQNIMLEKAASRAQEYAEDLLHAVTVQASEIQASDKIINRLIKEKAALNTELFDLKTKSFKEIESLRATEKGMINMLSDLKAKFDGSERTLQAMERKNESLNNECNSQAEIIRSLQNK